MRRKVLRQHKLCAAFVAVTGWGDRDFEDDRRQNDVIRDCDGERLLAFFFLDFLFVFRNVVEEGLSIDGIAAGIEGERKYVVEMLVLVALLAVALQIPAAKLQSMGAGKDKQGK